MNTKVTHSDFKLVNFTILQTKIGNTGQCANHKTMTKHMGKNLRAKWTRMKNNKGAPKMFEQIELMPKANIDIFLLPSGSKLSPMSVKSLSSKHYELFVICV